MKCSSCSAVVGEIDREHHGIAVPHFRMAHQPAHELGDDASIDHRAETVVDRRLQHRVGRGIGRSVGPERSSTS